MLEAFKFFRLLDFDVKHLHDYYGVLAQLWNNRLDGLIIRNIASQPLIEKFLILLDETGYNIPVTRYYWGKVYGRVLTSELNDIEQYYKDAAIYDTNLPLIWGDGQSWEYYFRNILHILYGKSAGIPKFDDGNMCTSSTIRVISDGKSLTTHCGNQFAYNSSKFNKLKSVSILDDQLSYFLLLQKPMQGGDLTVFNAKWSKRNEYSNINSNMIKSIEASQSIKLELNPGDLLIFQGGQIYHRVECINGPIPRITLGGFLTPSKDLTKLYFWS